jgi:hypothetical protein
MVHSVFSLLAGEDHFCKRILFYKPQKINDDRTGDPGSYTFAA